MERNTYFAAPPVRIISKKKKEKARVRARAKSAAKSEMDFE